MSALNNKLILFFVLIFCFSSSVYSYQVCNVGIETPYVAFENDNYKKVLIVDEEGDMFQLGNNWDFSLSNKPLTNAFELGPIIYYDEDNRGYLSFSDQSAVSTKRGIIIQDNTGLPVANFDIEGGVTTIGTSAHQGAQALCPADGMYCQSWENLTDDDLPLWKEHRDYFCNISGSVKGSCLYNVDRSTVFNCELQTSIDFDTASDGAIPVENSDHFIASSVWDYTSCSGGECVPDIVYDTCSGGTVYEKKVDSTGTSFETESYVCSDHDYNYCTGSDGDVHRKLFQCGSGACELISSPGPRIATCPVFDDYTTATNSCSGTSKIVTDHTFTKSCSGATCNSPTETTTDRVVSCGSGQSCHEGSCCTDSDGDGICNIVDGCPTYPGNVCPGGACNGYWSNTAICMYDTKCSGSYQQVFTETLDISAEAQKEKDAIEASITEANEAATAAQAVATGALEAYNDAEEASDDAAAAAASADPSDPDLDAAAEAAADAAAAALETYNDAATAAAEASAAAAAIAPYNYWTFINNLCGGLPLHTNGETRKGSSPCTKANCEEDKDCEYEWDVTAQCTVADDTCGTGVLYEEFDVTSPATGTGTCPHVDGYQRESTIECTSAQGECEDCYGEWTDTADTCIASDVCPSTDGFLEQYFNIIRPGTTGAGTCDNEQGDTQTGTTACSVSCPAEPQDCSEDWEIHTNDCGVPDGPHCGMGNYYRTWKVDQEPVGDGALCIGQPDDEEEGYYGPTCNTGIECIPGVWELTGDEITDDDVICDYTAEAIGDICPVQGAFACATISEVSGDVKKEIECVKPEDKEEAMCSATAFIDVDFEPPIAGNLIGQVSSFGGTNMNTNGGREACADYCNSLSADICTIDQSSSPGLCNAYLLDDQNNPPTILPGADSDRAVINCLDEEEAEVLSLQIAGCNVHGGGSTCTPLCYKTTLDITGPTDFDASGNSYAGLCSNTDGIDGDEYSLAHCSIGGGNGAQCTPLCDPGYTLLDFTGPTDYDSDGNTFVGLCKKNTYNPPIHESYSIGHDVNPRTNDGQPKVADCPAGFYSYSVSQRPSDYDSDGNVYLGICKALEPGDCAGPDGQYISNGIPRAYFFTEDDVFGEGCRSELRTCNNGVLSGTFQHNYCKEAPEGTNVK